MNTNSNQMITSNQSNINNSYSLHRQWIKDDMMFEYDDANILAFDLAVANGDLVIGEDGCIHSST